MTSCSKCGKTLTSSEETVDSNPDDGFGPLLEVGRMVGPPGEDGPLCARCREEAKLFGAAAPFGSGGG